MAARKLLADLDHALRAFLGADKGDDEVEVEAWDRIAVFRLDKPDTTLWADLPCADAPPKAYLLMTRKDGDERVHELLWAVDGPDDRWPVVELNESGEGQVIAGTAIDYIDALLTTGGRIGGGTEEDLEAARDDASVAGVDLASTLMDELDRDDANFEALAERCDLAQERWSDPWFEAIEGLDV